MCNWVMELGLRKITSILNSNKEVFKIEKIADEMSILQQLRLTIGFAVEYNNADEEILLKREVYKAK